MVPYQAESVGCFASKFHHPQHAWPGHFDGQAAGTSLRCGEKEMVWLHLRGGGSLVGARVGLVHAQLRLLMSILD